MGLGCLGWVGPGFLVRGRVIKQSLSRGSLECGPFFPLAVSLGGSFCTGGCVLGDEGIIGGWQGLRTEFGQGFPYLGPFFTMDMLLGDPFGSFG